MEEQPIPNYESAAVTSHLTIMQNVIQRMAENSRSCKVWCVTLVSAILVLVAQTGNPQNALLALVPTALFLVLDTYYLALERGFRIAYDAFVEKLQDGCATLSALYVVRPGREVSNLFLQCLRSFSIWPFYLMVAALVLLSPFIVAP